MWNPFSLLYPSILLVVSQYTLSTRFCYILDGRCLVLKLLRCIAVYAQGHFLCTVYMNFAVLRIR
jgi:hypothetical protein